MSARPPPHDIAEISSEGFDEQDIQAITDEATRLGVSFDDACKALILERARERRKTVPSAAGLLLRFLRVH